MGASKKIPARGERTGVQMLATSLNVHFFKLPLKKATSEKKRSVCLSKGWFGAWSTSSGVCFVRRTKSPLNLWMITWTCEWSFDLLFVPTPICFALQDKSSNFLTLPRLWWGDGNDTPHSSFALNKKKILHFFIQVRQKKRHCTGSIGEGRAIATTEGGSLKRKSILEFRLRLRKGNHRSRCLASPRSSASYSLGLQSKAASPLWKSPAQNNCQQKLNQTASQTYGVRPTSWSWLPAPVLWKKKVRRNSDEKKPEKLKKKALQKNIDGEVANKNEAVFFSTEKSQLWNPVRIPRGVTLTSFGTHEFENGAERLQIGPGLLKKAATTDEKYKKTNVEGYSKPQALYSTKSLFSAIPSTQEVGPVSACSTKTASLGYMARSEGEMAAQTNGQVTERSFCVPHIF